MSTEVADMEVTQASEPTGELAQPSEPSPLDGQAEPSQPISSPTPAVDPATLNAEFKSYIGTLESRIAEFEAKAKAAPAPEKEDPYAPIIAEFTDEFGDKGGKVVGALVEKLRALEARLGTNEGGAGQAPITSVQQIEQRVKAEAMVHGYMDQLAKNGHAETFGENRAARQSSPIYQAKAQQFMQASAGVSQLGAMLGLKVDDGRAMEIAAALLTNGSMSKPAAVQAVVGQMAARNGQRMLRPNAGAPAAGATKESTGRQAAVDAIKALRSAS